MAEVKLQNVWKIYGHEVEAVKDLDLEINDGEFASLLGPSGCGKSSTLRMIAGLEEVTKGNLFIGSNRVNDFEPSERDVSMVFENYALLPHMNVFENIAFPLVLRGLGKNEIKARVKEISKILDLDEILKIPLHNCGGGEKQRIGIARAFIRKSSVLLMDEPISHLDYDLRARTRAELARLQRLQKITTVYVTHDQSEALAMSDRIAVINFGELQQYGTPDELYNHPGNTFVAQFIGEPSMNMIPCRLSRDGGTVRIHTESYGFDITLTGSKASRIDPDFISGEVLFGFRPSDFALVSSSDLNKGDNQSVVKAGVINYEPGCEHSYIDIRICEYNALLQCPYNFSYSEGESIFLDVTRNQFHLFDQESGISLLTEKN